ncbi:MAG: hypothetical protein GEV03_11375 [Streptosporangiales bacterium]|nr:hypothetical protein [Streptosporangiales bacterium]
MSGPFIGRSGPTALAESYRERARRAAFGTAAGAPLQPARGTAACIEPMIQVYDYYGRLYLERPHHLLWAGLAHLAGAPIVQGLANAVEHGVDNAYCRMLVDTCRRIFADVAWLHEAFVDDPATAVALARLRDREGARMASYEAIWADLAGDEPSATADANRRLLENEQFVVAQRGYDALRDDARAVSRSVRAVHPYHDDFDGDDIGDPEQRWAWVAAMWRSWAGLPVEERTRLVRLPFDDLRAGRFAPR